MELDYKVHGTAIQAVEVRLKPGEQILARPGVMVMMDQRIDMDVDYGHEEKTRWRKIVSGMKQWLSGGKMSLASFTNQARDPRSVYFSYNPSTRIIPINLTDLGGYIVCRKGAFLCSSPDAVITVSLRKKLGVALFGGKGFIMQKVEGKGIAFIQAGGVLLERQLAPGETFRVDTTGLVGFSPGVTYEVKYVGSLRKAFSAGEGLFFANLKGPGRLWVQTGAVRDRSFLWGLLRHSVPWSTMVFPLLFWLLSLGAGLWALVRYFLPWT